MTTPPTQKRLVQRNLWSLSQQQEGDVAVADVIADVLHTDQDQFMGAVFHQGKTPAQSVRRTLSDLEVEGLVVRNGRGRLTFRLDQLVDTILEGDAWELTRMVPDEAVPVIIADAPHTHLDEHRNVGKATRLTNNQYFKTKDLDEDLITEFYRVLKPGGYCFLYMPPLQMTADHIWVNVLQAVRKAGFVPIRQVTWVKSRSMGYRFTSESEPVLVLAKLFADGRLPECPDRTATDVVEHPTLRGDQRTAYTDFTAEHEAQWEAAALQYGGRGEIPREIRKTLPGKYHDTEKPVPVNAHLLKVAGRPGEILLDVFSGTGSASVAAVEAGMHFCAIEGNPRTVEHCLAPRLGDKVKRVISLAPHVTDKFDDA